MEHLVSLAAGGSGKFIQILLLSLIAILTVSVSHLSQLTNAKSVFLLSELSPNTPPSPSLTRSSSFRWISKRSDELPRVDAPTSDPAGDETELNKEEIENAYKSSEEPAQQASDVRSIDQQLPSAARVGHELASGPLSVPADDQAEAQTPPAAIGQSDHEQQQVVADKQSTENIVAAAPLSHGAPSSNSSSAQPQTVESGGQQATGGPDLDKPEDGGPQQSVEQQSRSQTIGPESTGGATAEQTTQPEVSEVSTNSSPIDDSRTSEAPRVEYSPASSGQDKSEHNLVEQSIGQQVAPNVSQEASVKQVATTPLPVAQVESTEAPVSQGPPEAPVSPVPPEAPEQPVAHVSPQVEAPSDKVVPDEKEQVVVDKKNEYISSNQKNDVSTLAANEQNNIETPISSDEHKDVTNQNVNNTKSSVLNKFEDADGSLIEIDANSCLENSQFNKFVPSAIVNMTIDRIISTLRGQNCNTLASLKLKPVSNKIINGHIIEVSSMPIEVAQLAYAPLTKVRCNGPLSASGDKMVKFELLFEQEHDDQWLSSRWRLYPRLNHDELPIKFASSNLPNTIKSRASQNLDKCTKFKVETGNYYLELLGFRSTMKFEANLLKLNDHSFSASSRLDENGASEQKQQSGSIKLIDFQVRQLYLDQGLKLNGLVNDSWDRRLVTTVAAKTSQEVAANSTSRGLFAPETLENEITRSSVMGTVQILHDHNNHVRKNNWLVYMYANWLKHEYRRQLRHLFGQTFVDRVGACFES